MPTKLKDIPWNEIRILYVTEQMSLAEMGRRFHISVEAIKSRSKRGKWAKEREARLAALERERGPVALIPPDETGRRRLQPPENNGVKNSAKSPAGKIRALETIESERVTTAEPMEIIDESTGSPIDLASDIWARRKLEHREVAYGVSHGAVRAASKGKGKIKDPTNWKDLDIADKMARRAAGLEDNDGPTVNVLINLGALNGALKAV